MLILSFLSVCIYYIIYAVAYNNILSINWNYSDKCLVTNITRIFAESSVRIYTGQGDHPAVEYECRVQEIVNFQVIINNGSANITLNPRVVRQISPAILLSVVLLIVLVDRTQLLIH